MEDLNLTSLIGYLIGLAGAIVVIFSRVKNENLKDLRERVAILENEREEYKKLLLKEREEAANQHIANREAIAALKKEIEIYRDLQLSSIAETNKQILNTLQASSKTANDLQHDGGLLVKTKEKK
jgi:hypothetical protein